MSNEQMIWNELYLELAQIIKQLDEEYKQNPTKENREKLKSYMEEEKEYLKILADLKNSQKSSINNEEQEISKNVKDNNDLGFDQSHYDSLDIDGKREYLKNRISLLEKEKGKKFIVNTKHGKQKIAKHVKYQYLKALKMLDDLENNQESSINNEEVIEQEIAIIHKEQEISKNEKDNNDLRFDQLYYDSLDVDGKREYLKNRISLLEKEKGKKFIVNTKHGKQKIAKHVKYQYLKALKMLDDLENEVQLEFENPKNTEISKDEITIESSKKIKQKSTNIISEKIEKFKNKLINKKDAIKKRIVNNNIIKSTKKKCLKLALSIGCALTLIGGASKISSFNTNKANKNIESFSDEHDNIFGTKNIENIIGQASSIKNNIMNNDFKIEQTNSEKIESINSEVNEGISVSENNKEFDSKNNVTTKNLLPIENLDFTRIATSAEKANNKQFVKVNHPEYWGDESPLSYKIVDDIVYIYEGNIILGFTDLEGIKLDSKTDNITNLSEMEETEINNVAIVEDDILEVNETTKNLQKSEEILGKQELSSTYVHNSIMQLAYMYNLSVDQLYVVYSTIRHEAGSDPLEIAAVTSTVFNRMKAGNWGGTDPYSVITANGQFASYFDGYYQQYLNNLDEETIQIINNILIGNVEPIHTYTSFRSNGSISYSNIMFTTNGNRYR